MSEKYLRLIRDILNIIKKYHVISIDILSRELGLPKTTLEKVVRKLVEEGILIEENVTCESCNTCPLKNFCPYVNKPIGKDKLKFYRIKE